MQAGVDKILSLEAETAKRHRQKYEHIYQTAGITDEMRFYAWVVRQIKPRPSARLLDIACGQGGVLLAAKEKLDVYGLDISTEALKKVRGSYPAAKVTVGNAEELPFASKTFDYVTCLGSLENFAQPSLALAEVSRVLKDEGTFCTLMPNKFWLGDILAIVAGKDEQKPFQPVERVATLRQWRQLLEVHDFSVETVRGYNKRSPLVRQRKLRSVRKFLSTYLLALSCPKSLAWSLLFLCKKAPAGRATSENAAWIWRAEWLKVEPS